MGDRVPQEQGLLFEDVRQEAPSCYDDVIEALERAYGNFPDLAEKGLHEMAYDTWRHGDLSEAPCPDDVERCLRIYVERRA